VIVIVSKTLPRENGLNVPRASYCLFRYPLYVVTEHAFYAYSALVFATNNTSKNHNKTIKTVRYNCLWSGFNNIRTNDQIIRKCINKIIILSKAVPSSRRPSHDERATPIDKCPARTCMITAYSFRAVFCARWSRPWKKKREKKTENRQRRARQCRGGTAEHTPSAAFASPASLSATPLMLSANRPMARLTKPPTSSSVSRCSGEAFLIFSANCGALFTIVCTVLSNLSNGSRPSDAPFKRSRPSTQAFNFVRILVLPSDGVFNCVTHGHATFQ